MNQQENHIEGKRDEEKYEPLMIPIPEAIVDENAVMIEFLHTLTAKVAVVRVLRSEIFTVDANVI